MTLKEKYQQKIRDISDAFILATTGKLPARTSIKNNKIISEHIEDLYNREVNEINDLCKRKPDLDKYKSL